MTRTLRFASVGAAGFVVQLGVLHILVTCAGVAYPAATAVAVEAAILHNFVWHERWTWRDRPARHDGIGRFLRLLRFNGAAGLFSIAGNVALMRLFVDQWHLPLLAANALAVAVVSALNFACADRFVFRRPAELEDVRFCD